MIKITIETATTKKAIEILQAIKSATEKYRKKVRAKRKEKQNGKET